MILRKPIVIAAIGLLTTGSAMAETVNFNEFVENFQPGAPFSSGSLLFAGTRNIFGGYLVGVIPSPPVKDIGSDPAVYNAFNGTPYLVDGYGSQLSITRTDLAVFTLDSFQMALGWYQVGNSATINVTYELAAGGTSSASLAISDTSFATFTPGLEIKKATFDLSGAPGGYISMDNINVTAIPEPETYAMMLAGLGLLGFAARRTKQHESPA